MSRGVKNILIATFLFAGMNVFVKLLSHLPVFELTLFRSIFTFFICYFLIRKKRIPILGSRRPVLVLRGIFGSISLILFFQSVHSLPLATATLVHYITPFFTTFFGYLFLKERFYKIQWLFLMICFTGIVITQSANTHLFEFNMSNIGLICGLGGCIAAASAYNCIRKIGITEDPNVILIYFSFITVPVSLVLLYLFGGFKWPNLLEWFYILCMGFLTQAAQFYMTLAYQNEKVGKIAIFTNIGIVYAIINGVLFFKEIPTTLAWIGIIIVITGLLLNVFSNKILGFLNIRNDSQHL
jgi:drug/metabolite transporter (DMT)-like permease